MTLSLTTFIEPIDTQHNDSELKDILHNDIVLNDTQHNGTECLVPFKLTIPHLTGELSVVMLSVIYAERRIFIGMLSVDMVNDVTLNVSFLLVASF